MMNQAINNQHPQMPTQSRITMFVLLDAVSLSTFTIIPKTNDMRIPTKVIRQINIQSSAEQLYDG